MIASFAHLQSDLNFFTNDILFCKVLSPIFVLFCPFERFITSFNVCDPALAIPISNSETLSRYVTLYVNLILCKIRTECFTVAY